MTSLALYQQTCGCVDLLSDSAARRAKLSSDPLVAGGAPGELSAVLGANPKNVTMNLTSSGQGHFLPIVDTAASW